MLRRMMLGGLIALTCGVATARPPVGPLTEGRELDPVARDSYGGLPPVSRDPVPTPAAPRPGDTCVLPLVATLAVLDAILSGIAIPLGPLIDDRDGIQMQ